MIYADHAATTKISYEALEAMRPFLTEEYGNASSLYSHARKPRVALNKAREMIADCIGALPEEIFFTSCGTESDNWAIKGIAGLTGIRNEIITSEIEHHAILHSCSAMENKGFRVRYLKVDSEGTISPEILDKYITARTALVSIMMGNNEIGTIEPIMQLAQIAHNSGSLFHTDAVQAVGHILINVNQLKVDMLSSSAHKYNGPKGIGFLYIRKGTKCNAFLNGGSQEFNMRAGTENTAFIVGMAAALQQHINNLSERKVYLKRLETIFYNRLNNSQVDYRVNGSLKMRLPGNINISLKDQSGEILLHRLDLKGICISTGSACDSVNTQISHVIKAICVPPDYANGTIRITLDVDNTEKEVIEIADAIINIAK